MARQKKPQYEFVKSLNRYRKREKGINDDKPVYGRTPEELENKLETLRMEAAKKIESRQNPTLESYIEHWATLHEQFVRPQTMRDYNYIIKRFIIPSIGDLKMKEVRSDDILEALGSASEYSSSIYTKITMILKMVFDSAVKNRIIAESPCPQVRKGGKNPKAKESLTDEQVDILLDAVKGTIAELFVNIAVYTGMRREEILGLKWECVFLDVSTPYLQVKHTVVWNGNTPEFHDELKTDSAERDIPIPPQLVSLLRERKETSKSDFVICNRSNKMMSQTQFRNMWHAVVCRTTQERTYTKYVNGEKKVYTISPKLGEKANCRNYYYTIDFYVHPHKLRRTYITRLIYNGVDPKTVQYLAGHKSAKVTMDIYARVMYNSPEKIAARVNAAFAKSTPSTPNNDGA